MDGGTIGGLIGIFFGAVWGIAGATGLPRAARKPAALVSAFASAILIGIPLGLQHHTAAAGSFRGGIYGIAVVAEMIAIIVAVNLIRRARRRDLLLPAIGVIAGLHFIGLWQATGLPLFLVVFAAMCGVSLAALAIPGPTPSGIGARQAVAGFRCAFVLWLAGGIALLRP